MNVIHGIKIAHFLAWVLSIHYFVPLYGSYWLRSRCGSPFHQRAARLCWRKIRSQRIGKIFGWSLFSRPVKGTYVCASGYIIFSEERPRTPYYPPSALLDIFGNGMKTSSRIPRPLRDLGHFSRYLESVLHSPQQPCLVFTILRRFRGQTSRFNRFSRRLPAKKLANTHIFPLSICNVSLSHAGSDMTYSIFKICAKRC